jgi:transcriptional antiterminator RfaH
MIEDGNFGELKWYAVHVRSNQERNTARFLADRGVDVFLPSYNIRSNRMDRMATLTKPLFPGYLFVYIDNKDQARIHVLKAPGTVRIVGFGGRLVTVPDATIESLKILVDNGSDEVRPHPLVQVGSVVQVVAGAFSGATGILCETKGRKPRLVVTLDFLGRAVSVPIMREQVQPVLR